MRWALPYSLLLFGIAALSSIPHFAFAGSQTYTAPGTYTFTVPAYGTLTVEVWGGGGGGGGGYGAGSNGGAGGSSSLGTVYAGGGGGGLAWLEGAGGGPGGTATGGDINEPGIDGKAPGPYAVWLWNGEGGASPHGGAGGKAGDNFVPGADLAGKPGDAPGGGGGPGGLPCGNCIMAGGGGGGAYAKKTYAAGELSNTISVIVGDGGPGGAGTPGTQGPGGAGAGGKVSITWTDAGPPPTCTITFDKNPVAPGESTTMHWQVQNAPSGNVWFTIANYGPASVSGQTQVSNNQSTDYTGRVYAGTADNLVATCPATLEVTAQNNTERYSCRSNQCTLDDNGAYASLSSCTSVCHPSCPAGRVWNPSTRQCEAQCPSGFIWDGTQCVSQCPAGTVWDPAAGQCKDENQCRSVRFCRGTDAYLGDPGKAVCPASFLERCEWGCSGGACLQPPQPVLSLSAIPSLVRHGDTTTVSWSAQNVRPNSCTVSGTNGDSWTQQNGDRSWSGEAASAIPVRTVFTLSCTDLRSRGVSVTRIVNVIPVWGER